MYTPPTALNFAVSGQALKRYSSPDLPLKMTVPIVRSGAGAVFSVTAVLAAKRVERIALVALLRFVHRAVRILDQDVRRISILGINRDPDARLHGQRET